MIVRCGTDLTHISRIEKAIQRSGLRLVARIWTPAEISLCTRGIDLQTRGIDLQMADTGLQKSDAGLPESPSTHLTPVALASLAARFAGKEAIAKALGSGIGPHGIGWTDLEILRDTSGAPVVSLHGAARQLYDDLHGQSLSLSLSHDLDLAQAFCVMLCQSPGKD